MKTITIKQSEVPSILATIPKSAIFTAVFKKVDGSLRSINGRRGVKSALTSKSTENGGSKRVKPVMDKKYIIVYDMHVKGYRHVNQETITKIRAAKVEYLVEG